MLREEKGEVQAFVEDQLRKGYIYPSKSPQTSPIHFVAKKDGTWRMVQDYRHVNQWTVKNRYPLPLIADILNGVGKRKQEEGKKEVKKVEKDEDEETLKRLVPKRFWKWKKVFGKRESERMPVRKM